MASTIVEKPESVLDAAERKKVLNFTLDKIEKDFGKGAIMKLGSKNIVSHDAIPTGALSLDLGLGIGGIPRGRVVEIYGPESSGKNHTHPQYCG